MYKYICTIEFEGNIIDTNIVADSLNDLDKELNKSYADYKLLGMTNYNNKSNALCTLMYALKMRFNRWIKKITKRINCEHKNWRDVYCIDTQLFMYRCCDECGKKITRSF